jgi:hypothetical protein
MSDDPLAEAVASVMREEQIDPRLERLARGELSDAERRTLEEEAKSNAELAQAMALHAPLSSEYRQKLAATVRPKVIPLRRIVAIASLAAAAAVGGIVVLQPEPEMPAYALNARASDAEWRGEAPRKREVRSDSTIEIVLTPATPVPGKVAAKLFVLENGALQEVAVRAQISDDGAVRWLDRADTISGGRTGPVTLVAKVGRADDPERAWQSMTLDAEIRAAGVAP